MKDILMADVDSPAKQCAFCGAPSNALLPLPVCAAHALQLYGAMRDLLRERTAEAGVMQALAAATDASTAERLTARWNGLSTRPEPEPVVYYALVLGFQIKIGYSKNVELRLHGYPPGSVVLATEPGGRDVETQRLRQFARHRITGREWFDPAPELIQHINALRHAAGDRPVSVPAGKAGD